MAAPRRNAKPRNTNPRHTKPRDGSRRLKAFTDFNTPLWQPEPRQRGNPVHTGTVRKLQCSLCGERRYIQAYRLSAGPVRKAPAEDWVVPLCPAHVFDLNRYGPGREQSYFADRGIDCYGLAKDLRGKDATTMARVLLAYHLAASAQQKRGKASSSACAQRG